MRLKSVATKSDHNISLFISACHLVTICVVDCVTNKMPNVIRKFARHFVSQLRRVASSTSPQCAHDPPVESDGGLQSGDEISKSLCQDTSE